MSIQSIQNDLRCPTCNWDNSCEQCRQAMIDEEQELQEWLDSVDRSYYGPGLDSLRHNDFNY